MASQGDTQIPLHNTLLLFAFIWTFFPEQPFEFPRVSTSLHFSVVHKSFVIKTTQLPRLFAETHSRSSENMFLLELSDAAPGRDPALSLSLSLSRLAAELPPLHRVLDLRSILLRARISLLHVYSILLEHPHLFLPPKIYAGENASQSLNI